MPVKLHVLAQHPLGKAVAQQRAKAQEEWSFYTIHGAQSALRICPTPRNTRNIVKEELQREVAATFGPCGVENGL